MIPLLYPQIHLRHLKDIFQRLHEVGLKLKPAKWELFHEIGQLHEIYCKHYHSADGSGEDFRHKGLILLES